MAAAGLVVAAGCRGSSTQPSPAQTSTAVSTAAMPVPTKPPAGPGTVAGFPSLGREVGITPFALAVAAWDGERLWLADVQGRLVAIDGASGKVVVDRHLDVPLSSNGGLTLLGAQLVGIGVDGARKPRVIRIDPRSGGNTSARIDDGRPLGHTTVVDGSLVVVDYLRGVVAVNARTGATRVLVAPPGLTANLVRPAPAGTFWLVEERPGRLVRVATDGRLLVDERRPRDDIRALASDDDGNAWLAEARTVTVVAPSGGVVREFTGFTNAARFVSCGKALIVSDVDTGDIAALTATGEPRRLSTGTPGEVVACAESGVWYLTIDGDLVRLPIPG